MNDEEIVLVPPTSSPTPSRTLKEVYEATLEGMRAIQERERDVVLTPARTPQLPCRRSPRSPLLRYPRTPKSGGTYFYQHEQGSPRELLAKLLPTKCPLIRERLHLPGPGALRAWCFFALWNDCDEFMSSVGTPAPARR